MPLVFATAALAALVDYLPRDLARAAAAGQGKLREACWWLFRLWVALETVALLAFLAILLLMVLKPQ